MNFRRPGDPSTVDVTVVVPANNEEGNILPLMDQFGELARKARFSLEVVLVDDGSTDQTLPRAVEAQNQHPFLHIISLPYRRGLTEALRAGFSVVRGQIIVFYPADRQFHPNDIPRMVEKVRSGYDLVTGRKIGQYSKKFVSSFYNRLSRLLFPSIKVTDLNSVKAFRRELIEVFDYRHDWHRFWVAIAAEAGYRIGEVDVTLYQRGSGRSKFGYGRIPSGVLDLLAVKFQYHTMRRPLWYFGMTGLFMLVAAFILGSLAVYQRFVEGHGYRPLVYLVMSLGLMGVVFFAMGFLAEAAAGLRQKLDMLKPGPKYHVYKPGYGQSSAPIRPISEPRPQQQSPRREVPAPDARPGGRNRPERPNRPRDDRRQPSRRPDPTPQRPESVTALSPNPPVVEEPQLPMATFGELPIEAAPPVEEVPMPVPEIEWAIEPVVETPEEPLLSDPTPPERPQPPANARPMYGRRRR